MPNSFQVVSFFMCGRLQLFSYFVNKVLYIKLAFLVRNARLRAMFSGLIITSRETLEAALVAGIVLAFLNKTGNSRHAKFVWLGVGAGVLLSLILAFVFEKYLGGFTGRVEEIYEGVMMMVAAGLLTWMILWMLKQRSSLKANLENKVEAHVKEDHPWSLFLLVFVGVAREGIETVIFLKAALLQSDGGNVLLGGFLGIVAAIVLAYILFKGFARVPLRKFFTVTSVLLIMFAAGLFAHGIHEFEEAGVVPVLVEHVWDINWLINEKSVGGEFLKGLFGYNGNPSLGEVIGYLAYLSLMGF